MRWFKISHRLTRLLNHLKFVQLSDNKGSFYKVYFIAGNLAVIPFMITLAVISIITDTRQLLYYSAGLSLFYTINLLILKYLKMPQNPLLFQMIFLTMYHKVISIALKGLLGMLLVHPFIDDHGEKGRLAKSGLNTWHFVPLMVLYIITSISFLILPYLQ
jgi:hypothetical protein